MARIRLYQLYDTVSETVVGPIMAQHRDAAAIRGFNEILADTRTEPGQHPADFNLLCLGEQDTETGEIIAFKAPTNDTPISTGILWIEINKARAADLSAQQQRGADSSPALSERQQLLNNNNAR